MKHKHCELIKAWADGAIIQKQEPPSKTWKININPLWQENAKYRIKPTIKPDIEKKYFYKNGELFKANKFKPNVVFIFDGETGYLKDTKVIK